VNILLLIALITSTQKSVEVRFTQNPPRIDGFIEEVWQQADSAFDFVQSSPYENQKPTEKTSVYLLQDKNNLYVAFRCYAEKHKPTANLTKDEDYVSFAIDPFQSKTMGYYFWVFGSGIVWDGWVLDDGRNHDDSWEGVWYRAIKMYGDRYEAEFKIPFKSIRYKRDLKDWGIQFMRYIVYNQETDYWNEVTQATGDLVSKWGSLTSINPQASGYYFELYPEAYTRFDHRWYADMYGVNQSDSTHIKPSVSMNAKWDITSQTTLNATLYPDFAQIEADPYTLNLGRYPVRLSERRPFFIEGRDIFRMSDMGEGIGFFDPLNIFYSRTIGKSIGNDAVPIIGGLKLTSKSDDWNFGLFSAYTDNYTRNNVLLEPNRGFGVLKLKRRVMGTSDIGLLASGTYASDSNYNYVFGLDQVFRQGSNQLIVQTAYSDRNHKQDLAISTGYKGMIGNFLTMVGAEAIGDSFDVSDIGFLPWAGRKRVTLMSGPYKTYRQGLLTSFYLAPILSVSQEPGNKNWSKGIGVNFSSNFRTLWSFGTNLATGRAYEADTNYVAREFSYWVNGRLLAQNLNFGGNYSYGYNYARGFLAYQGYNWFTYNYSIIQQMSVGLSANWWIEWNTFNKVLATTPLLRPNIYFRFNSNMGLTIFSELVMQTPQAKFDSTDLYSVRTGVLFNWNFLPKSWIYIALNDSRSDDAFGKLQPRYQIGAIKVKYLFYF